MSRSERESKMKAMYGDRYPAVLVSELGGRKRDRRNMLQDELGKTLGSYQQGSLTARLPKGISYAQAVDELLMGPTQDEASRPEYQPFFAEGRPDRAMHAAFFGNMTRDLGGGPLAAGASNIAGFGREGLQGLGSLATGDGFFGPNGFDWSDIAANYAGIGAAQDRRVGHGRPRPKLDPVRSATLIR